MSDYKTSSNFPSGGLTDEVVIGTELHDPVQLAKETSKSNKLHYYRTNGQHDD